LRLRLGLGLELWLGFASGRQGAKLTPAPNTPSVCIRLSTIPHVMDRRTDGRTDRQTGYNSIALCMLAHVTRDKSQQ